MDPSFKRVVESVKKRIPLAVSVARDPETPDTTKARLLLECVESMAFIVDVLQCMDLENIALRRELKRLQCEDDNGILG